MFQKSDYNTLRYIAFGIFAVLFMNACSSGKTSYYLSEEKIVEVIIDFQIAKAAAYKYPVNSRDSISKVYYDQIYKIHEVSVHEFEHDVKKLEQNPDYYKTIYDKVSEELRKINTKSDVEDYE